MARKPYTWARKPTRARRTYRAVADQAKARAKARAQETTRKLAMKLRGHKVTCRSCGKTFRTPQQRDRHVCDRGTPRRAKNETRTRPGRARSRDNTGSGWGKPKTPARGHHSCGCGKTFRNDLELNDHARQHTEREDRASKRKRETARRTEAVNGRKARGGRPKGAPKQRPGRARDTRPRAERNAEWHAHRMQHAAGRMDRAGKRIPGTGPSPRVARVVQPKTRVAPKVR